MDLNFVDPFWFLSLTFKRDAKAGTVVFPVNYYIHDAITDIFKNSNVGFSVHNLVALGIFEEGM